MQIKRMAARRQARQNELARMRRDEQKETEEADEGNADSDAI